MPKKNIEKHDPVRQFKRTVLDRCNVVSGLAVDLGEALRTGKVPTKVGPSDVSYNGIENPANILFVVLIGKLRCKDITCSSYS